MPATKTKPVVDHPVWREIILDVNESCYDLGGFAFEDKVGFENCMARFKTIPDASEPAAIYVVNHQCTMGDPGCECDIVRAGEHIFVVRGEPVWTNGHRARVTPITRGRRR